MLSAIPWIGKDLVEFLWGIIISSGIIITPILLIWNSRSLSNTNLQTIGVLRARKPLTDAEKEKFLSIPASFLGILVGLIDGYILIGNAGRDYIRLELVIALDIRDLILPPGGPLSGSLIPPG